ncbi:unnamed protein product, partial [Symbiodinium sp. KB8]
MAAADANPNGGGLQEVEGRLGLQRGPVKVGRVSCIAKDAKGTCGSSGSDDAKARMAATTSAGPASVGRVLHGYNERARAATESRPHGATYYGGRRTVMRESVVSASRALPLEHLEHAVAHVCRKGGVRVSRNVRIAVMNSGIFLTDMRCIELVAHGMPFWHGTRLAATLVCPVTQHGEPQCGGFEGFEAFEGE